MLTLDNLRTLRLARSIDRHILAASAGIPVATMRDLETGQRRREPWLSEAAAIARVLGLRGITPLINGQDVLTRVDGLDFGTDLPTDVAMYRSGARLTLSVACRVALKLGLPDPIWLASQMMDPVSMQVWDVIERNERGAEPGCCPWCLADRAAGHPHRDTCLPNALWAPVDPSLRPAAPLPRIEVMGKRQGSGLGKGLQRERTRMGWTQKKLADAIGVNSYYLARVERCESNLTTANAEKIAAYFQCETADLYRADVVSDEG